MRLSSYPQWKFVFLLFTGLLCWSSCKKEDEKPSKFDIDVFYKQMQTLTLEVVYEPGADPYDFNVNSENVWEFAEANIESLFMRRPIALDVLVPAGLAQMTEIPDQNKTSFTTNDILNIAGAYRLNEGNSTAGNIFIVFLDGYFKQNDTVRQDVLGVNIVGTTVVTVFKPLVSSAHAIKIYREFIEQSIVIHEVGHAVGLVFNGLPLTSSHQDIPHGAHCTNEDCVMYWQNEHPVSLSAFIQAYNTQTKPVIFGEECIRDVTEYEP